jgi:phosphate uptake regulator
METRKLIKLGNSSFAISLPKKWIKTTGLKRGELVFLEDHNGNLIISSKEKQDSVEEKSAEIEIGNKDLNTLIAEISSIYINNFNYIILENITSRNQLQKIKKILNNFMGLEIIEQNNNKIVVKDTLGISMISINEIIRRMDNTIRSMFEDLGSLLEKQNPNKKLLSELVETDKDVNKLYFLIWKLIRKGMLDEKKAKLLGTDLLGLSSLQWLAMNLESIGDEIKRIARFLNEEKPNKVNIKSNEILKELVFMIKKNYEDAMTAYYKNDKDLALEIASKNDALTIEKCNKFFKKYKDPNIARVTERLKTIQGAIHYITRSVSY